MKQDHHDKMETLNCGSLIQHGPYNDRIYLMKASPDSSGSLPLKLIFFAEEFSYTKIFAKVPEEQADSFFSAGYALEASIPHFYNGFEDGMFLAYYTDDARACELDIEDFIRYKQLALNKKNSRILPLDTSCFLLRSCDRNDTREMAEVYRKVFPSYPFPIYDHNYLLETMHDNVDYFCVEYDGKIVALSSAEMDFKASNSEMTDFATLPEQRGNGLGVHLLTRMEKEVARKGIKMAYTIARAASPGMNITFAKLGYAYGGRLKNNTNISGTIESMNVWYKSTG